MRQLRDNRAYQVSASDFPVTIEVAAEKQRDCRVVPSYVHVMVGREIADTEFPRVKRHVFSKRRTFTLDRPNVERPEEMTLLLHAWFDEAAPEDARYEITVRSVSGQVFAGEMRRPAVNPAMASMVFLWGGRGR